jgi:hypothetical protein
MDQPNKICIHLYSDLFPCSWADSIPQLKYSRERLQDHLDDLKPPLPEYLQEVIELCQGCNLPRKKSGPCKRNRSNFKRNSLGVGLNSS